MAAKKRLILLLLSMFFVAGIIYAFAYNLTRGEQLRPYNWILLFHVSVLVLMMSSLYLTGLKNKRKILFAFLVWSSLKIILSGLFFAFLIWYFSPADLKMLTVVFISIYVITLLFEVWFAKALLEEK